MIIGTLNIKGGCSAIKRRSIHHIITKGKACIFLIQETKLKHYSVSMACSFWNVDKVDFTVSDSEGMSDGLISLWNYSKIEVLFSFRGNGYLGIKVMWEEKYYYVCNVYSSCVLSYKRELWENILDYKSRFYDGEWIIAGDFNTVKNGSERSGRIVRGSNAEWEEFSSFIDNSGLEDVPCKGKKYSWYSGNGKPKSRIDRFLLSSKAVNDWGVVGKLIGLRDISAHCPV